MDERGGTVSRTSHALAIDGRVYVVDPVEGAEVDERVAALGAPAAVLVLLDRHRRDSAAFGRRLDVPVLETPFDGLPDTRLEARTVVRNRFWREVALWWPERRVLVAADAIGTLGYMKARPEPLGVHPLLRLMPPRKTFGGLNPEHILVGHGEGVHGPEAAQALRDALTGARRRIPALAGSLLRRR